MADEFIKGLSALLVGGLGWMTIAGWYRTPSFEGAQLIGEISVKEPSVFDSAALLLMDVFFWFAVFGALTFWVVLPLVGELRTYLDERSA